MSDLNLIPTEIVPRAQRCDLSPSQVEREFKNLIAGGARLAIAGKAKNVNELFAKGLKPKHKLELFDTTFYLTNVRQIPELRFFVGYVVQTKTKPNSKSNATEIFPRIIYKDLSLAWRSASHFTSDSEGIWVGKGDVRIRDDGDYDLVESLESTTDIPLEMQTVLEELLAWTKRPTGDEEILGLVIRRAPNDRVEPYRDFIEPRQIAASNPRNLINRGRSVASFKRKNDPTSLKFVAGFQPDFKSGIIETDKSHSRLYGGQLKRFRILSANRLVQYGFIASKKHVWIIPPQATTTQLSSYGVRTIDVVADDDLFIPGYEYHHYEETEDGPELYSQIPEGFAGDVCPVDDQKADASPWLDKIPIIQEFRRTVLAKTARIKAKR